MPAVVQAKRGHGSDRILVRRPAAPCGRWAGQDAVLMKKQISGRLTTASIIAGFSMAFAVSGRGLGSPAHGPRVSNAAPVVEMGFESYDPADVTIRSGETVEWRNTLIIAHTVTDDPGRARKQGDAGLPAGAEPFHSGEIAAGQVYMRTFTTPGTYRYFCTHHETDGMVATVAVKPAS
jgi:plastocyanin